MYRAIILAGERSESQQQNELLKYANAEAKSLIKIKDRPMIVYILNALMQSNLIEHIYVIGNPLLLEKSSELQELLRLNKIEFKPQKTSPVESILSIFEEVEEVKDNSKIFITTSDNVLIKKEWIDYFLKMASESEKDILIGVNNYKNVKAKYPESKRTVLKLNDISLCFCNLFAIMNSNCKEVIVLWKKVERVRKNPFKMAMMLMPLYGLILFALGLLTSDNALNIMSKKLKINIGLIIMPFPEACIDVDKIEDLILVNKILST